MTGLRHPGLGEGTPGGYPVRSARQSPDQHAPPPLRTAAVPRQPIERVVHLEGHQPTVHPVEEPLADLEEHVRGVDGIVDREHQRGAVRGDPQMSVVPPLGPEREQPSAFREIQDLRTALVDPHAPILGDRVPRSQGRRSPGSHPDARGAKGIRTLFRRFG